MEDELPVCNKEGFKGLPTNLFVVVPGGEPHPAMTYEFEAQWTAEEFPEHILFFHEGGL